MPKLVRCACGKKLRINNDRKRKIKCPSCGEVIDVAAAGDLEAGFDDSDENGLAGPPPRARRRRKKKRAGKKSGSASTMPSAYPGRLTEAEQAHWNRRKKGEKGQRTPISEIALSSALWSLWVVPVAVIMSWMKNRDNPDGIGEVDPSEIKLLGWFFLWLFAFVIAFFFTWMRDISDAASDRGRQKACRICGYIIVGCGGVMAVVLMAAGQSPAGFACGGMFMAMGYGLVKLADYV